MCCEGGGGRFEVLLKKSVEGVPPLQHGKVSKREHSTSAIGRGGRGRICGMEEDGGGRQSHGG